MDRPCLDLPLTADEDHVDLANRLGADSVHFGLDCALSADARPPLPRPAEGADRTRTQARIMERWSDLLAGLRGPRPYLLLNARFHAPARYCGPALAALARAVERLADAGLAGVVWADAYLLAALGRAVPDLAARLEAAPSVNCGLDSADKAFAALAHGEACGFRPPTRIILDRGLNRRPQALARTAAALRARRPGLRLLLLANEGCLPYCPFRPAHEALIAGAHAGLGGDLWALNRDLGCIGVLRREPWRLFASPFIRPEDAGSVVGPGLADGLKLCGRRRGGPDWIRRTAEAYAAGRYAGNLLHLLDALGEFEDALFIDNTALPRDFHARLGACDGDCAACGWCRTLFERTARRLPPAPGLRPADRLRIAGQGTRSCPSCCND